MLRTAFGVAAAALAAACTLAACGPVKMGAAAIVGGQRISAASLTSQICDLAGTYQANKKQIQLQFPVSQAPQQVLTWLVRFRIRDQLARRYHVTVSTGESQRALAAIAAQARQSGLSAPLAVLAAGVGLPRDLLPDLGRYQAIQFAVIARVDGGVTPMTPAAQQALAAKLRRSEYLAAKSLHIRINPQFGQMDYSKLTVIPVASKLSAPAPQPPTPSPTPSPQLTPC